MGSTKILNRAFSSALLSFFEFRHWKFTTKSQKLWRWYLYTYFKTRIDLLVINCMKSLRHSDLSIVYVKIKYRNKSLFAWGYMDRSGVLTENVCFNELLLLQNVGKSVVRTGKLANALYLCMKTFIMNYVSFNIKLRAEVHHLCSTYYLLTVKALKMPHDIR